MKIQNSKYYDTRIIHCEKKRNGKKEQEVERTCLDSDGTIYSISANLKGKNDWRCGSAILRYQKTRSIIL